MNGRNKNRGEEYMFIFGNKLDWIIFTMLHEYLYGGWCISVPSFKTCDINGILWLAAVIQWWAELHGSEGLSPVMYNTKMLFNTMIYTT